MSNLPDALGTIPSNLEADRKNAWLQSSYESQYSIYMESGELNSANLTITSFALYVVMVLAILITVLLVSYASAKIYYPIRRISELLHDQSEENDWEINRWERGYDFVIDSVKNALKDNKRMHEQLSEKLVALNKMHTVALQAQINPHFLYNTLQMMQLCVEEELGSAENSVSNMIGLLSDLILQNFSTKSHITEVQEELQHLTIYYRLQSVMYGDRMNLQMEIPDELYDYIIPKITLQPIVENAIQHGVKPSEKKCDIIISAEIIDDKLIFCVRDNGIGIKPKELEKIKQKLSSGTFSHDESIGLNNIHQRIRLIFGEEYGIAVESEEGKGTTIRVSLPARRVDELS